MTGEVVLGWEQLQGSKPAPMVCLVGGCGMSMCLNLFKMGRHSKVSKCGGWVVWGRPDSLWWLSPMGRNRLFSVYCVLAEW